MRLSSIIKVNKYRFPRIETIALLGEEFLLRVSKKRRDIRKERAISKE